MQVPAENKCSAPSWPGSRPRRLFLRFASKSGRRGKPCVEPDEGFTNRAGALKRLARELEGIMIARHILTLMIAACIFAGSACHRAAAKQIGKTGANRPYQIYLLKGLADIFSSGMD